MLALAPRNWGLCRPWKHPSTRLRGRLHWIRTCLQKLSEFNDVDDQTAPKTLSDTVATNVCQVGNITMSNGLSRLPMSCIFFVLFQTSVTAAGPAKEEPADKEETYDDAELSYWTGRD
ncbi:hypothetical protein Bbelb_387430 [Branchiostoma belcheri]|nr:hypothetical protein Bbelb_387430 [Branchiostoma belcheri]